MKAKLFLAVILAVFLFSCAKQENISFQNPQNVERPDEVIVLTKDELSQKVELPAGLMPLFKNADNSLVPFQLDDMDNDGNWDEVALLLNFAPNETKEIVVEFSDGTNYPPEFEKRTNLRLGITQEDGSFKRWTITRHLPCTDGFEVIAQGESVNWENDKIGFRNYFDCRNVKDLFGNANLK
jgi:hypothetical protein